MKPLVSLMTILFCSVANTIVHAQFAGPDFDPLGLIAEVQLRRQEVVNQTYSYRFTIPSQQRLIEYADWNLELAERTGISYLLFYSAVQQSGSQGGVQNSTGNGNANVILTWTPKNQSPGNEGAFVFHYLNVGTYGPTDGIEFAQSLGISSFTSDSIASSDSFQSIAWRQQMADGKVDFRMGQVIPTSLFNSVPYANDNRAFMASPLSTEASRRIPGAGIGAIILAEVSKDFFLGAAVVDANGAGGFLDNSFLTGDFMWSLYTAYRPEISGLGKGNYQLATHFIDATANTGFSRLMGLNIDQAIGENWSVFAKYNRIDGERRFLEQSAATGIVWKKAFGWNNDWLGVGAGWSDPDDERLRDEYVLESFWRIQLTPTIQYSTDVQFWFDPSLVTDNDFRSVMSFRLLMEL